MNHFRSAALQFLNDVDAIFQTLLLLFQIENLNDLFVELRNFALEVLVACVLMVDGRAVLQTQNESDQTGKHHGRERRSHEFLSFALALEVAPREQINAWHVSRSSSKQDHRPSTARSRLS